jgi:hypothetical protein
MRRAPGSIRPVTHLCLPSARRDRPRKPPAPHGQDHRAGSPSIRTYRALGRRGAGGHRGQICARGSDEIARWITLCTQEGRHGEDAAVVLGWIRSVRVARKSCQRRLCLTAAARSGRPEGAGGAAGPGGVGGNFSRAAEPNWPPIRAGPGGVSSHQLSRNGQALARLDCLQDAVPQPRVLRQLAVRGGGTMIRPCSTA